MLMHGEKSGSTHHPIEFLAAAIKKPPPFWLFERAKITIVRRNGGGYTAGLNTGTSLSSKRAKIGHASSYVVDTCRRKGLSLNMDILRNAGRRALYGSQATCFPFPRDFPLNIKTDNWWSRENDVPLEFADILSL